MGRAAAARSSCRKPGAIRDQRNRDAGTFLEGKIAKWWMPDDVVFVEALTYGATGKIQKMELRTRFAAHYSSSREIERVTGCRARVPHPRNASGSVQAACLPGLDLVAAVSDSCSCGPGRAPGPGWVWTSFASKRLAAFGAHHHRVERLPAVAMLMQQRPSALVDHVGVAPMDQRHHHRIQVEALLGQDVFVPFRRNSW